MSTLRLERENLEAADTKDAGGCCAPKEISAFGHGWLHGMCRFNADTGNQSPLSSQGLNTSLVSKIVPSSRQGANLTCRDRSSFPFKNKSPLHLQHLNGFSLRHG